MDQSASDFVKSTLGNHVILRGIISHLGLGDLKRCRLVNKFWAVEVSSYMRESYCFDASVSEDHPCASLDILNQVASGMNPAVVPISGLTLIFKGDKYVHSESSESSGNDPEIYGEILSKLPVKHLRMEWDSNFQNISCPAVQFASIFSRQKIMELHTLEFDVAPEFLPWFDQGWTTPCSFPELQVLDLGERMYELGAVGSCTFVRTIVNQAPHLS